MSIIPSFTAEYIKDNNAKAQQTLVQGVDNLLANYSVIKSYSGLSLNTFFQNLSEEYINLNQNLIKWPKTYQASFLTSIAAKMLTGFRSYSFGEAELKKHMEFFLSLFQDKEVLPNVHILRDIVQPEIIFNVIHKVLVSNQEQQAEKLISLFSTPSSRNIIIYGLNEVDTLFKTKNQVAIDFLLKHFDGWEHEDILGKFLPYMNIATLDALHEKTGAFTALRLGKISKQTLDSIPQHIVVEFIERFCQMNEFNLPLHNIYVEQLEKSTTTREQTRKFITQYMTKPEYLKSWYHQQDKHFFKGINLFLKHDLIGMDEVMNLLTQEIPSGSMGSETFKNLMGFVAQHKIQLSDYVAFTLNLCLFEDELISIAFIKQNLAQIREIKGAIDYQSQHFADIDSLLLNTGNVFYLLKKMTEVGLNSKEQDNIVNLFEQQVLRKKKYFENQTFQPEQLEAYYQYTLNKLGAQAAFNKWFLTEHIENNMSLSFKCTLLKKLAEDNITLTVDLSSFENNPLYIMLNYPRIREYMKNHNIIYSEFSTLSHVLSEFFEHRLLFTHQERMNKFIAENSIWNNYDYQRAIAKKPATAKKFLGLFGREEKTELQLVKKDGQVYIVNNPTDLYVVENNTVSDANRFNTHNDFGGLMTQAQQDMQKVHQTLEKYATHDLNLEVKIRAERLIFNQLTFLESVKHGLNELDTQDTIFLKNNLGKYLIQCLEVYGKSVSRYEKLLNTDNKKSFNALEELEKSKSKIDAEALKQIDLLEKELELVKEHILNQFNQDLLRDMRVSTRVLENKIENHHEQKLVKLVK